MNFLRAQIQQRWKIFYFHVFAFPGCFLNTASSQSIKIGSNQVILSIDNGNHWKSMNWIPVSDWYYRLFTALTIYNGSPPLFFFWHESDSTAKKTHPRVTQLISKHENEKCGNYYTQVSLQNPLKQKRQNVRHSFNSRFRLKDFFPNIFTVFRYQSIKITWFLTTFIDFDFELKNWTPTNLANISHQQKILSLVLKKRFLYKW